MNQPLQVQEIATAVQARFRGRPGSEYIASTFTIGGLVDAMVRARPRTMLEVGAGIGTLTYAACMVATQLYGDEPDRFSLYTIEDHDGCRQEFQHNLQEFSGRYTLLRQATELPPQAGPFDLLCIDGPQLEQLPSLSHRAIIYVEGDRRSSRERAAEQLGARSFSVANYRPLDRAKGYWIFQLDPTGRERLVMGARRMFEQSGRAAGRVARRYLGDETVKQIYRGVSTTARRLVRRTKS